MKIPIRTLGISIVILTALAGLSSPATCARLVPLDDSTDNVQVDMCGPWMFVLKKDGSVWRGGDIQYSGGTAHVWEAIGKIRQGTTRISATCVDDQTTTYSMWLRKGDHGMYRYDMSFDYGPVQVGDAGSREILGAGALLYTLETNGDVYRYDVQTQDLVRRWTRIKSGPTSRILLGKGGLWALDSEGDKGIIQRYSEKTGRWEVVDTCPGAVQVVSRSDQVYALTRDGRILRLWGTWQVISEGEGAREIVLGTGAYPLFVLDQAGDVLACRHDDVWITVDSGHRIRQLAVSYSRAIALDESGRVFSLDGIDRDGLGTPRRIERFESLHGVTR